MRTIYIAGRMTGMPGNNYEQFNAKAKQLRAMGWNVVSPAEMDLEVGLSPDREYSMDDYRMACKRDLKALEDCDAIYMMHGYETSPGASWEWAYAKLHGKDIYYEVPRP